MSGGKKQRRLVVVADRTQVNVAGVVYAGGSTLDLDALEVDDAQAQRWLAAGIVVEAPVPAPATKRRA